MRELIIINISPSEYKSTAPEGSEVHAWVVKSEIVGCPSQQNRQNRHHRSHHRELLRIFGAWYRSPDNHTSSSTTMLFNELNLNSSREYIVGAGNL